jgi:hypothetical protein
MFLLVSFSLDSPPESYMDVSSHTCYILFQSHHPWLDHSNYIWRRVQAKKLNFAVSSSLPLFHPFSVHIFIYYPQHPFSVPSVFVLPLMTETKFHIHTKLEEKF